MCVSNAFLPNIIIMSKEEKTEHKLCVLLVLSTHRCFSNMTHNICAFSSKDHLHCVQ